MHSVNPLVRISKFETPSSIRDPADIRDWIGLSSVLRPCQHSIGYMGDGFYKSKDPTNSIKVLKEHIVHRQIKHTIRDPASIKTLSAGLSEQASQLFHWMISQHTRTLLI